MDSLPHLNAFISERLAAAAVEIFGAVEKTLREYQREISRNKQEMDHLRSLLLWPEVRLYRSAGHQLSPHLCSKEASPEHCYEEDQEPHVSTKHHITLHIKEEHEQRTGQRGPSCGQQCDATTSPQTVRTYGHKGLPSHLYRILTVERTAHIKAEPGGEEFATSLSEIHCGVNEESCGHQQESLKDPLEVADEQDWSDEQQQYLEQDWSPCQDLDPHQIKVETFPSSSPQEEYELPLQSESRVCDEEPHSSRPSHDQTLSNKSFHTAEEKRRAAEGVGCKLSSSSLNPHCPTVLQGAYGENREDVENGQSVNAHTLKGMRKKKRKNSSLCSKEGNSIPVEEGVNDVSRERRHTCPICAKRFKESSHLKEHVRIHTGEKPYQCKWCGVSFRQSGALTLHMRIHTGERPYQCTDCGRRFNRKGDMETHRVTHTGERPHLCTVCGKSFRRKSNLNTHLKIHAQGKKDHIEPL